MQKNIKENAESFRKIKDGKFGNKPPNGEGEKKSLVNVENASCSLMIGIPTKVWYDLQYTGIIFLQTSSQ